MYAHFEQHMLYGREQGQRLRLEGLAGTPTIAALTAKEIEEFLNKIGMGDLCASLTASKIEEVSREARNPYEN
jgi:hypothetical protein